MEKTNFMVGHKMANDEGLTVYKEFELEKGYSIRQNEEFNAIFKDGKPKKVLKRAASVYNRIFDFKPRAKSIVVKKDRISIDFIIETKKNKNYDFKGYCINVGYNFYDFTKKSGNVYSVDIPYDKIHIPGKSTGIFLFYKDDNGFTYKKKLLSMTGPHNRKKDHKLYYSKVEEYENHSIFVYETWAGYLTLAYREINNTDSPKEQNKIKLAFLKHKLDFKLGRDKPSILLFEKFCEKYEESAKYVYEKLIDDGCENVFFILDEDSEYYKEVPEKYRKNLIDKHSFKHYYEYFNAKAFISTESMNHSVELTTSNQLIRRRQMWDDYYFYFLQHGVMYAYSLKGRNDFVKGSGFRENSFVVVSSETEANHFIEDGKFDRNDLIKCGLPKLDHAIQNENADKILIMPTSRNYEYSIIRDDTENSSYYKFSKNIIESIPKELEDKIVFIAHPLVMEIIKKTDLAKYMPEEFSYDELLKDTRLLITDYSSISYDAFYRGCNVIFAWMEKEECLKNMGVELKLNDENAFADIAYDYDNLSELILKNYNSPPSEENLRKYRDIVEFDDNRNTERFIDFLYDSNLFPDKTKKYDMKDAAVTGIEDQPFTGRSINNPNIKVDIDGKKLIRNLDYKVTNHKNRIIGTATCEVKGMGIFSGSKKVDFQIKKNIGKSKIKFDDGDLKVTIGKNELTEEEDFICEEVDYSGVGIKKIVIKGIGEYSGQKGILIDEDNSND